MRHLRLTGARLSAALAVVLLALPGRAASITFPAGKYGELTDPNVLPVDKRPTASDYLNFDWQTKNPLELTVSNTNEFMLGGLRFDSCNYQRFTITVADGTTVKLPGTGNSNKATEFRNYYTHGTYRGGTWDFCGTGDFWGNGTWNVGYYCTNVLDGVTFTNVDDFVVSDYNAGCCVILTNGTRVTAKTLQLSRDSKNRSRTFVVAGGSTVKATSSSQCSTGEDNHCRVLVTGAGSKLVIPGGYGMSYGSDMGIRIEKGGEMELTGSGNFDYYGACEDNYLEVDGGTFRCQALDIGMKATKSNFEIRVLDGGTFDSGVQPLRLYQNETIIVSNATFTCGGVSDNTGTNCHLKLYGPQTQFTWDKSSSQLYYLFTSGKYHSIELDDHANWTTSDSFNWTVSGSHCRLSLANGSTLTATSITPGYKTSGGGSPSNEVTVASGSTLTMTASSFSCGTGTQIVISNGTVRLKAFNLGQDNSADGKFVFQGTTPRLVETDHFYIGSANGTLAYDLSDGPYALDAGVAPAEVGNFYVIASAMRIRLTGLAALEQKLSARVKMPIFKCASFFDNASRNKLDAAIAAENEAIAATFGANRHVLSRENTTVYLTSKPARRGCAVYLR